MGSNGGKKPKNRPVLSKKPPVLSMILGLLPPKGKKEKSSKPACLLDFLAESEGFGSLRSPASLLRKLSYCRLLLTRLRLAKDYKGSNPFLI